MGQPGDVGDQHVVVNKGLRLSAELSARNLKSTHESNDTKHEGEGRQLIAQNDDHTRRKISKRSRIIPKECSGRDVASVGKSCAWAAEQYADAEEPNHIGAGEIDATKDEKVGPFTKHATEYIA
jgi:hypothetical protein